MLETSARLDQVRAVLFDVDGTLYDQAALRRVMVRRLVRAHLRQPRSGVRTVRILGAYRRAQEGLRTSAGRHDLAVEQIRLASVRAEVTPDEVASCVARWMEQAPLDVLARYRRAGLQEALAALQGQGIRLGVVSDYAAGEKLAALGVAEYFDVVVDAGQPDVGAFKPNPRGLEVALGRLGVVADEALYVGDRVDVDAAAAAAAGLRCAIVGSAGEPVPGEHYIRITSFQDLQHLLEPR